MTTIYIRGLLPVNVLMFYLELRNIVNITIM